MSGRDPGAALRVECPPKVNLYLRVVRRREDGYHEVETVLQAIDGGDTLYGSPADRLSLECDVPIDGPNLVIRAAELLSERFPPPGALPVARGAALRLVKRTPIGAGLGGGSSDAAGALLLLSRLWQLPAGPGLLHELAARLGSDVPFFLRGGTAIARGRGEILEFIRGAPLWLVLVKPPAAVSTPWAYRQWRPDAASGPSLDEFLAALRSGDPAGIASVLRNDLEPGVAAAVPEIAAAREWLLAQGLCGVRMTGSGSAVFGIAPDEAAARRIAACASAPGRVWAAACVAHGARIESE